MTEDPKHTQKAEENTTETGNKLDNLQIQDLKAENEIPTAKKNGGEATRKWLSILIGLVAVCLTAMALAVGAAFTIGRFWSTRDLLKEVNSNFVSFNSERTVLKKEVDSLKAETETLKKGVAALRKKTNNQISNIRIEFKELSSQIHDDLNDIREHIERLGEVMNASKTI